MIDHQEEVRPERQDRAEYTGSLSVIQPLDSVESLDEIRKSRTEQHGWNNTTEREEDGLWLCIHRSVSHHAEKDSRQHQQTELNDRDAGLNEAKSERLCRREIDFCVGEPFEWNPVPADHPVQIRPGDRRQHAENDRHSICI